MRSLAIDDPAFCTLNVFDTPPRYVAGTMLEITYGKRVTSMKDELVQVADRAIEGINVAGSPGSMIVDFFPVCACSASDTPGHRI